MPVSSQGLALIEAFEGFSATPYICPAGLKTIGYGHVILPQEQFSEPLTREQARLLLQFDVRKAERAVMNLISIALTQSQFDALVSFTFNVGSGALQRSRLRRVVNRGAHADVPFEFMRWVYAKGSIIKGLQKRRVAESALYLS